ncbi:MAG: hypothetical protein WDO19_14335 [Bacteroidota bacterium]
MIIGTIYSQADLVVMDANWGYNLSGITILKNFLNFNHAIKVIFVTAFFDAALIGKIKDAGAKGYFYRNVDNKIQQIANCITDVYNNKTFFIAAPLKSPINEKNLFQDDNTF